MSADTPTLGVVAISKNEEEDMPRFLEHLLPWVNEIVIVDDGSTDATVDIIKAAGPKVKLVEHPRDDELGFAGQRNIGIDEASSDWLIHMDIDMRVPPSLAREMQEAIRDPSKDAYYFRLRNFYLHRLLEHGGQQGWNKTWLCRRESARFSRRLHEQIEVTCSDSRIGQIENPMWHLNDNSFLERLQKSARYSELEGRRIVESGLKVKWRHFLLSGMP
ncbi:MAG: glycosyltransferase family 2 protein [Planctomycetota bacterium]|jgi:glycosyltransferase involved in cell wall biosynthesis|nr:glycosyltransferase family 2 protein [Planctomycetota bacterium]